MGRSDTMLKAKISQTKSNLYAVKTTKYDTTDIELIVETTDSSPWLNPKFELLGIKSDGHEVRQTENFKIVDLNNHIVQVTLDEQFVTCEGNVDLQLLIKDGSRKSSTPFKLYVGRSLDSDILESHRNVKVLDELEKYIIEGREYISEATELAQSTANYVQAVNTQAEANEAQRLQNESQRQSAETKRNEAEDERKQAEVLRVQNEDTRQSAEVIRIANEQTRLENESNRIERETARENKESIRQTQEQQRHTSESTRQSQEATRQSNEDNRKQAEKSRSQEETIRINNEATREQAEDNRQSQELDRQSAESARSTAETNRNNAESTRTQNENTRKSQETTRQQKETERQSAETARQQNETSRQTAETRRAEAENARKAAETTRANDMQAFKDEANRLATELNTQASRLDQLTEDTENQINEFVETNQTAVDSFLETADSRLVNDKDKIDYWGNHHQSLKDKSDYEVDKLLGDFNSINYQGEYITAQDTISRHIKNATMKGHTEVNCIQEPSGVDIILPYDFEPGYGVTINDTKETGAVGIELQGQTLVNIVDYTDIRLFNATKEGNVFTLKWGADVNRSYVRLGCLKRNLTKPNTRYVIRVNILENTAGVQLGTSAIHAPKGTTIGRDFKNLTGVSTVIMTTGSDYTQSNSNKNVDNPTPPSDLVYLGIWTDGGDLTSHIKFTVDIYEESEYHDGIPYFEGMASVTTPTVATTGKNLLPYDKMFISPFTSATPYITKNEATFPFTLPTNGRGVGIKFKVEPNTTYTLSTSVVIPNTVVGVAFYKNENDTTNHGNKLGIAFSTGTEESTKTFTTPSDCAWIVCGVYILYTYEQSGGTVVLNEMPKLQLEHGAQATSYEPFKSSSLTLPEEITLRSLPNGVRDTYNVQTGEYVQRIGKMVLDGTQPVTRFEKLDGYNYCNSRFTIYGVAMNGNTLNTNLYCDKFSVGQVSEENSRETIKIYDQRGYIELRLSILKSKLSSIDGIGVVQYLQSNPVTVQYELATPIITKVPLSQVLKSWNTLTRINTSIPENSLKPIIAPVNPSYEAMLKPSTQYSIITNPIANGHASTPIEFNLGGATAETVVGNGCTLITTPSTLANNKLEMSGRGQKLQGGVMVLEGNKTGMMFSHFDGMKSVENPTVRVNNANLFDPIVPDPYHMVCNGASDGSLVGIIRVKPNTTYTLSVDKDLTKGRFVAKMSNRLLTKTEAPGFSQSSVYTFLRNNYANGRKFEYVISNHASVTFTTLEDCHYIYVNADRSYGTTEAGEVLVFANMHLKEASIDTGFISHQSSSLPLTIPMRSLPNGVCDTLDLLTGEYVQKVYEYTFTGEERISDQAWGDQRRYSMSLTDNNLPMSTHVNIGHCNMFMVGDTNRDHSAIRLSIEPNSIRIAHPSINVSTFKEFLRSNMVTFQYGLAEPIVTQLDLQWEDDKLFAYDGTTHFFVDIEGGKLMPILDIDVPTNLSAATSRINREKNQLAQDNQELQTTLELAKLKEAQLEKELAEAKEQVANEVTTLNKRDDLLEESQAVQDNDIVTSMLASAELFEMVLLMMPMSVSMSKSMEVNPMVEVYVTLILKGEKTIEQVPAVIRDKVQAQLDLLTK